MDDDAPVIYGLEFQARSLTAVAGESEAIQFLVGTQSLKNDNQVHQINFDEENNLIDKVVFSHRDGEIWHISASPVDSDVFATCYNKTSDSKAEMQAAIWKLPSDYDPASPDDSSSSAPALELLSRLGSADYGDSKCVLWQPADEGNNVILLADNNILLYDINSGGENAKLASSTALEGKGQPKLSVGRWNPHHNCFQIGTANDTTIRGWDTRNMEQVYTIENAHGQVVRDLDFNPNKQYYLASCGDDCKTKFWDIRNPTEPVKVLSDHSHWVWTVRFNHFHDQLVLTSSSDSRVILTSTVSISSEPFGHLVDEDEEDSDSGNEKEKTAEPCTDGVLATYEEHEDSVYSAEWSTADPWLFASLSYDGRLVINRVPRAEKYKILL